MELTTPAAIHDALYDHLVLPAQLPQRREHDRQLRLVEYTLTNRLVDAANIMSGTPDNASHHIWQSLRHTLIVCQDLNRGGRIDKTSFIRGLQSLGSSGCLILHIESQNAGLIIRRAQDPVFKDCVVFEAFEASPKNEDVLAAKGALRWDFPGIAVAVPYTTFSDGEFQLSVATFVEQASLETTKTFAAHTFKAGATIFEHRNTGDPSIITSLFMAILEENGRRITPPLLRKRVRDDVCWFRAESPWRRLPYWLVLRVGIERYLSLTLDAERGRLEYKFFVCVVLSTFLDESIRHSIATERIHFLKKKICRRLVKLDMDQHSPFAKEPTVASRYEFLFQHLGPKFNKSIQSATSMLQLSLAQERTAQKKHIPLLPRKAWDPDLHLSLRMSHAHLKHVLQSYKAPRNARRYQPASNACLFEASKDHLSQYAQAYHKMIDKELQLPQEPATSCLQISKQIMGYAKQALPLYLGNPEQNSQMLLTVMELWQKMDSIACSQFPLLQEYHPVFHPQMLDVLLLPQFSDMARVNMLQTLLSVRVRRASSDHRTIFEDPSAGCFGERYYTESCDAAVFKELHESIVEMSNDVRARKEAEWKRKSRQYEDLVRQIDVSACLYLPDEYDPLGRGKHSPSCPRCSMMSTAQRMRIGVFENPLPSDGVTTRAAIFELACPEEFAVYRDTTWWILRHLATPLNDGEGILPRCLLRDYVQLKSFFQISPGQHVGLASTTKPFITTHYLSMPFPVEWEGGRDGVCRPNGMRLALYDEQTSTWPGRLKFRPTFTHHTDLGTTLPKSSPMAKLFEKRSYAVDGPGPSSYEIMASQSSCPAGVNVHEYLAIQTLLAGKSQRWITLLTELASTNVNFSSEVTMLVVTHLAFQCGPPDDGNDGRHQNGSINEEGGGKDILRKTHKIFRDDHFCERLVEQLSLRLDTLEANWRETYLMDIVITILLRVHTLTATNENLSLKALNALIRSREICLCWVEMLRAETYKTNDTETARRSQQYALWAAILCKRTYIIHRNQSTGLDVTSLQTYIECCITVQDNLVVEVGALPQVLQRAIVSDIKLSYRLSHLVRNSIVSSPSVFRHAIRAVWPEPEDSPRQISNLRSEQVGWVVCDIQETDGDVVQVHYNYVQGLLLVDNRPLGKLPKAPEHISILNELFGDQALLTRPSTLPGMEYTLCIQPRGYRIDIGFNAGKIVLRACKGRQTLQLIDRDVFRSPNVWDLPGPILVDCFHWLDLHSGKMFITHCSDIWNINHGSWTLDVNQRVCSRPHMSSGRDKIVDPSCPLFNRVAKIFDGFEERRHILVYQPAAGHLQVEIRRLQLLFFVNARKVLESPQLGSEVDLDQDAGTWYGLTSKLVFRNPRDPLQRSILVPLGPLDARREGNSMVVSTQPQELYGKFVINRTLGRIDCAAEPWLVYCKAQLHAYTSSVFPDPLTGRTGTEEALQWLSSGVCQPWTPLNTGPLGILAKIAQLSPQRNYYPDDLKVMKTDTWDEKLTESIQHEGFQPLVENILAISAELQVFAVQNADNPMELLTPSSDVHLRERAKARRHIFERSFDNSIEASKAPDTQYHPRDCPLPSNLRHRQVLEVTHLLRTWPEQMPTTQVLAQELSQGDVVGGYKEEFDKVSITDRLNIDVPTHWGSLVKTCREQHNPFALMFTLAPIAFNPDVKMGLVKTLAAFAIFEDLKTIDLPTWEEYERFKSNQAPQLECLVRMIAPFKTPPPKDDGDDLQQFASAKQLRKMRQLKETWELQAEADCKSLGNFLLAQWPCLDLSVNDLSKALLVDIEAALKVVRVEWKRLYQNMDLSIHLDAVQNVLDRRHSDTQYEAPVFIASEEQLQERVRGGEIPSLRSNLLKKTFTECGSGPAEPQTVTPVPQTSNTAKVPSIPIPARHPAHIRQPIALPSFKPRSTGTNVLAPSWMSSKTALIPSGDTSSELRQIISGFSGSSSLVRQKYGEDLQRSLDAFVSRKQPREGKEDANPAFVSREPSLSLLSIQRRLDTIRKTLERSDDERSSQQVFWLQEGQLWPAVTTVTLLEQLRSTAPPVLFGDHAKETLIDFGLAITSTQRDLRINDHLLRGDAGRYQDETANQGHSNWQPCEHPDWLLLEIEANLLIRPDQVDVALATISPASGSNSVLQMNMGQGKTSCIIPMVAAALADRRNLVRVVVPKALLLQTAQLLQGRLGGLLDRQVRHIPFSRRTPTDEPIIRAYHRVHRVIMKQAGVMVCQPEHSLSFMLSGLQRLVDNKVCEAGPMINVQSWLRTRCRDILDESDHTLAVRTQLIYPSGSQTTVDGHPYRWQVAQAVLHLVDRHTYSLAHSFPDSIEVVRRVGGGFPLLFFLRSDAEDALIRSLTADILRGADGILPVHTLDTADRQAVRDFLLNGRPRDVTIERIRRLCPDRPSVRQIIYLLRGIMVNRILLMTLKKRWNVQYGLHPLRDPIAVPFHAKGVPSEQSEWGHPDVAILFTCLAFYYDGISVAQLTQSLEHLLKSDDPSAEYDKWTHATEGFPESLRAWNSINVDDDLQLKEIWKAVRYNVTTIDYFMNNFVFPQHAKQFKIKLQSNGWDIPLFSAVPDQTSSNGNNRTALTTGFSGTNDNKTMLPLNIKQEDLPGLSHTNAEVLTYLLRPNSRECRRIIGPRGERASESDLLAELKRLRINILIDAGAQILEMDNVTLAKRWLSIDERAVAALYFDQNNKPLIITRTGRMTPLLASPYADDLSNCLVYLDEAHTRGTDLKFPPNARGALTLGLGQSKDHTVQAAMRLRQLGTTQSVAFFAPPEVYQSVLDLQCKPSGAIIDSRDVICWLLDNTCDGIEQLQPLFYSQGIDFCRRMQAAVDNPDFLRDEQQREDFLATIKQNEQHSLQQLYEPKRKLKGTGEFRAGSHMKIRSFVKELNTRRKAFQDTGRAVQASALQEVEQEREMAFEVETVRQVKKPQSYPALSFPGLHRDLESFALNGRMPAGSQVFIPILESLSKTGTGKKFRVSNRSSNPKLFLSSEFERTIKLTFGLTSDNFLRNVNWILWSSVTGTAVIIVPEEAEALLPLMRSKTTRNVTNLIAYSAPVTRKMLHFGELDFFSVPQLPRDWKAPVWLKVELGLYAGRLYFEWDEYVEICDMLGIDESSSSMEYLEDISDEDVTDDQPDSEGWNKTPKGLVTGITPRPLTFLQEWLAARRRGQDFVTTPMGFLAQGKPLQQTHPFFRKAETEKRDKLFIPLKWQHDQEEAEGHFNDDFGGIDNMGANEETDSDVDENEVEYNESEFGSDSEDEGGNGSGSDSGSEV